MQLKTIFKIVNVLTNRKIPCDIVDFLEEDYFSKSKDTDIKYGDMDLTHYIRSQLKNSNEEYLNYELKKANKKITKLKKNVQILLDEVA